VNYRHAFHAGNFGDCMKHALLIALIHALRHKPAAVFVLDTHAGRGRYDLGSGPAQRTGEWRAGIARIMEDPPPALADYVDLVTELGLYPGSPAIIRSLLRPQDRLVCCELHPEEHAALRSLFARDPQVAVHLRDGYEAIRALLPPSGIARGLVLIDPPYEVGDELERVAAALAEARHRFAAGVLAAWYPIKHRAPTRAFHGVLRASRLRDVIAAELWLREPLDAARLNGCGLIVVNPPFGFSETALGILGALRGRLGEHDGGDGFAVERLIDE
jgi:23S rRNA (adenine2030-N6)-methyltransferase